ncbi:MAG: hypothetical protein QXO35_01915 [Candidatus Micrarchaeia archaeon]
MEKDIKFQKSISENIDDKFSKILPLGIVDFCLKSDEPIDFSFIISNGIDNIKIIRLNSYK